MRRSAEIGHNLLWDAAGLLWARETLAVSDGLIARERLMLQLAHQVAQIIQRIANEDGPAEEDQSHTTGRPPDPYAPGARPTTPHPMTATSPVKGTVLMPQSESGPAARTPDVYFLFAHEPYYAGPGTREVNTTVVAADALLHPQVRQPDGVRIHDLLTLVRPPGEIIPLATLTHELDGGTDWPKIGDWEGVTTDLVQLVHAGQRDALSLGLREIARPLLCTGPHSHVRVHGTTAGQLTDYGPTERACPPRLNRGVAP